MTIALYCLFSVVSLLCLYFVYLLEKYFKTEKKLRWLPTPPGWPVIGNALEFGDSTQILNDGDRLIKKYGKILYLNIVMEPNIMTTDYDFVEHILGRHDVLNKSGDYRYLHKWLGTGLLTSDGSKWRNRRKMVTPAFHFSILEKFIDVFELNLDILISELRKVIDKDSVDIYPFINLYALDVICETSMGVQVNAQRDKESGYVKNVKEMCKLCIERSFSLVKKHDILYALCPNFYKESNIIKALHAATNSVIYIKQKELESKKLRCDGTEDDAVKNKNMTFLDILLQSTIDGVPLSKEDIREEVDTFMFEGHDTISAAASFTLYLLSTHPNVQKRALEEQKNIFEGDINRHSTYSDLQAMKYLEKVIKEALRMYPPVPMIGRVTNQEVKFKGNVIPKDVNIAIMIYNIMRDPDYFDNPEKFDPERFEHNHGNKPYSFIPFSAGPRNCIGQKFAMLELKSIMSRILRNFELSPQVSKHKMMLAAEVVLKSKNGIRLKLTTRRW